MATKILQIVPLNKKMMAVYPDSKGEETWCPILALALVEIDGKTTLRYIEPGSEGTPSLTPVGTHIHYSLVGYH